MSRNEQMLWPVSVPPIDLLDVADSINDTARMHLIQRLVCGGGEDFRIEYLRDWINDPIRDDESTRIRKAEKGQTNNQSSK
tara:strand:+ start:1355 stop:1597 length:243 start_codon:yes stop_codon:yes gene_type:complete